jgi:hypothetical protein
METVSLIENMCLPGLDEFTTGTLYCSATALAARFVFGRLVIMFNNAFFVSIPQRSCSAILTTFQALLGNHAVQKANVADVSILSSLCCSHWCVARIDKQSNTY